MIVEERKNNEINLEAIDSDLRMENVRQSAEKLGWDYFGRSVRRNLMEKRQTLDAGSRLDVLNSLAFMKEYLPIDKEANVAQKVQQLVEGLGENCGVTVSNGGFTIKNPDVTIDIGVAEENIISCKIGYFGQPLFEAPEALELMKNGEFGRLRDLIAGIISLLPKDITLSDKNACKDALRALEHVLIRDAADSSFTSICTSKYGFYSPRTELRPGRLYFIAEPFMVRLAEKEGKSHPDNSDLDLLPHIEFSFVKHDKPSKLPVFTQSGEWTTFNDANVCICVRFNHGFLCSQQTIRKLSNIVPKSPLVRNYVNFYRYMTGRSTIKSDLKMLTQFPDETDIQQQFNIDFKRFSNEDDVVAIEMFLSDLRDLPKLIETLRSEWMHASLWESILAICERKKESEQREVKAVVIELVPRRNEFYLQFDTEYGSMTMQICEKSSRKYTVKTTSQLTGDSPSKELDSMLSEKLNSSWNIPTTLTFAVADLKCRLKSILNCANTSFDFYKLQHSWLVSNSKTMHTQQETKVVANKKPVKVLEIGPAIVPTQLVYTREDDEEFRGSLLSSFGEVDQYYVRTSTIGRTRAQPRPKREPNQLTSMDLMSTELERGRHSMEGSVRSHDVHTSSFLESARVRMKQSIGAAHAVGLASHQLPASPAPGPMRQHSYAMGFDPPMPYDPSTHFPEPPAFGKKQRKSRAKKQPSEDGVASAGRGKGSRKGRGACAVGTTGGRKSTGGAGENPFGMDQMRPPLQRSFSDYPGQLTSPQMSQYQQMQQMQQYQQSQNQQYRMQQMQHQQMQSPRNPLVPAYTDEDSDEEWDPPPPPKPQVSAAAPRNSVPPPPPQQLGNPMVGYPGMPLQSPNHLPLTPSPLSAPPKPYSPEQNHFGMKMREVSYWKEIERIEIKPNVEKLKRHLFADPSQAASSDNARSTAKVEQTESSSMTSIESSSTKSTAATPKKKMCLEAAISKIRGQQEQALQKQQQQQQHLQQQESVESNQSEQLTPQPIMEQQSTVPPLLAPHQLNRARNLNDVFDDEADDQSMSTAVTDVKPPIPEMQKTSIDSSSSSSGFPHPPALIPHLKKESADEAPEREKEKLIIKIPKIIKTTLEDRKDEKRDERREKDRERDRDRDRDGDRDRERNEKEKDDKAVRDKEKKERERERRRQRDRERAEQKRSERDKDGKDPSTSSSLKKRKLDKKDEKEKDRSEPDRKKGKSEGKDYNKTTTSMTPTSSLRNYRIPKKDTVEDDKKDVKDETLTAGPSTESKKEATAAPILRKESTISTAPPLQRKESFTSQSSSFAQSDHHREVPLKKKPPPPPNGPPPGSYPGVPNVGPIPSNIRGNNSSSGSSRKPPMPPPPPMMRGPPAEQMYRERAGSMRGFPPSSHYHGSVSGVNKQVASYAQGLPPGMGPPAIKPHGSNYQASQWVRPPTHRDSSHSYHGMPSLGPPQLQRELPPPPPQMIPLPKDPPVLREHPRERAHRGADDDGPDSPEEGTLRIDDE